MRPARNAGGLAAVFVVGIIVALTSARCTYSPDFPSDTLRCSTAGSQCPDGYKCKIGTNTCFKNEDLAGGGGSGGGAAGSAGGAGGAGGTGGAAGTRPCAGTCQIKITGTLMNANGPSAEDKLLGHWVFDGGSIQSVMCSDGSMQDTDLGTDFIDVTKSSGMFIGSYFCNWNLNVGPQGNVTIIRPGQSCTRMVMTPANGNRTLTWHGSTFTFGTLDGKTGTLMSMITLNYIDDPAKTGCSL